MLLYLTNIVANTKHMHDNKAVVTASNKDLIFLSKVQKLVSKILHTFVPANLVLVLGASDSSFSFIRKLYERGLPFSIKYIKESRNLALRYISGKALSHSDIVSIDKTGFPV